MIGYLRLNPAPADAVLADITSTGNLVIAKDYSGNAYLPEWAQAIIWLEVKAHF